MKLSYAKTKTLQGNYTLNQREYQLKLPIELYYKIALFRRVLGDFRRVLGDFRRVLGDFRRVLGDFRRVLGDFRRV